MARLSFLKFKEKKAIKKFLKIKKTFLWPYAQKKYLFESKKLFVWKTFFDVKKFFILMKQNLFDSNKISLDQINICSNQINFCLKSNKLYLWTYINASISLFWRKINLIQTNIYLVQRYFVWIKQILFHLNKSFLQIKESRSNNIFSLIQSNIFSECNNALYLIQRNFFSKKLFSGIIETISNWFELKYRMKPG